MRPSDSKELRDFKERQVFSQILALQRVSNFRELTYWALINTTAYYGWGVRGSVTNASTYWGNTASNSFRNAEFLWLCHNIAQLQRALLKKEPSGIFCYDNCQVGTRLIDQRGQSSKFLSGTHLITHKAIVYSDTSHNTVAVGNTYDEDQLSVSPVGMRMYKTIPLDS